MGEGAGSEQVLRGIWGLDYAFIFCILGGLCIEDDVSWRSKEKHKTEACRAKGK